MLRLRGAHALRVPAFTKLKIHIPGTSSVSLSLRTPRLHFSGLFLTSSYPSEDTAELETSGFGLPKSLRHRDVFEVLIPPGLVVVSCFSLGAITVDSEFVPMMAGSDSWRYK